MIARIALALVALRVAPTLAFDTGAGGPRALAADTVASAAAFVGTTEFDPVLMPGAYTKDVLTLAHQHASGTTLDATTTIVATSPSTTRFVLEDATATLGPAGTHDVRVRDNTITHPSGTYQVTLRTDITQLEGASTVGAATLWTNHTVEVSLV